MYLKIKKQSDFQKLFVKGNRLYSSHLTILYVPAKKMRLGISVGKKHGKAHVRNRVKRLLRESFRKNIPLLKGTYAFILLPKPMERKTEYSFHVFEKEMQKIFKRAEL